MYIKINKLKIEINILRLVIFSLLGIMFSGCYSFKGISIDPAVNSFYIGEFNDRSQGAPANLSFTFIEDLSNKIRSESRLKYKEVDPDISFEGEIRRFQVAAGSVTSGEQIAYNRLTIEIFVKYVNYKVEKDKWEQSFKYYADFDPNTQLLSVQDGLIERINEKLIDDIFNKAFTNW